MENLKENKNCYATPEQREVMLHLLTHPAVEENFFLTGGTALSVFYLNHRKSKEDGNFFLRCFSILTIIIFSGFMKTS